MSLVHREALVQVVLVAAHLVVDVEAVVDSAEDAVAVGLEGREVSVDGREVTAGSSAIARIAAARGFTAICLSNGKAPTPTPSSSR